MPTFYDLMKFAATGIASPDMTAYYKMRALAAFGGWEMQTLTGIPPLSFKSNGKPLISWSMLGNTKQTGTPSPQNIIMPDFCGKLVGSDWVIPITCAGQTTPVYLGEVETTRKIKKLVLDGTENWGLEYADNFLLNTAIDDAEPQQLVVCTHQQSISIDYSIDTNFENVRISYTRKLNFRTRIIPHNLSDFKSYLQQQYAAGTPVTVWYVLARPKTAIVNEPLAKIGDYADELHSYDTTVGIPTAKGQNTLTVDTELQPSSMTITYKS